MAGGQTDINYIIEKTHMENGACSKQGIDWPRQEIEQNDKTISQYR